MREVLILIVLRDWYDEMGRKYDMMFFNNDMMREYILDLENQDQAGVFFVWWRSTFFLGKKNPQEDKYTKNPSRKHSKPIVNRLWKWVYEETSFLKGFYPKSTSFGAHHSLVL
jgi:hypothetical protein